MSKHYYDKEQDVVSEIRDWSYTLRGFTMRFFSDRGVFSRKEVDFGSRLLIETFEYPTISGEVIDVGCGYGPIGLSIAKIDPTKTVHLVDVNERALDLARRNAERNHVTNIKVYQSDCLNDVPQSKFAAILTNPPIRAGKKVVYTIFEQAEQRLCDGGELWVVIQKKQGAPSAINKLESLFHAVDVVAKKKGYYIIKAKKFDQVNSL